MRVYLEYNLLDYIRTDRLSLPVGDDIEWIFSDEHFNEINRGDDRNAHELLQTLQHVRARKLRSPIDERFQFVNETDVLEYRDPVEMYTTYLETVGSFPDVPKLYNPLIAFFNGNTDEIEPITYGREYFQVLDDLLADVVQDVEGTEVSKLRSIFTQYADLMGESFGQFLESVRSTIKPLPEARKLLTKRQLSDLDPEDGSIIDQIWDLIGPAMSSMTKDQFFGKYPFGPGDGEEIRQPVFLGIVQCHSALNYLGYFPDRKVSRPSKIPGVQSDAAHIAYGAFCDGLFSEDARLCKKASAIYAYFNTQTQVIQLTRK